MKRQRRQSEVIRREFLRQAALGAGGLLLGACGVSTLLGQPPPGEDAGSPDVDGSVGSDHPGDGLLPGDAGVSSDRTLALSDDARPDDARPGDARPEEPDPPGLTRHVIAAQDSSPADKAAANYLWTDTALLPALKSLFAAGNAIFEFRPGTYRLRGETNWIRLGSGSFFKGSRPIQIPADQKQMPPIDAKQQAVFFSTMALTLGSTTEAHNPDLGVIRINGASNITLKDFVMQGHVGIQLSNCKKCAVTRVVVSNWVGGIYPTGHWCNMGYQRTGTFWCSDNCDGISYTSCIAHCSSHHGFLNHTSSVSIWVKNISYLDCRALHCGCGMLRGNPPNTSKPYGYTDWSVGFDLQEKGSVENILVDRCYAFDCWKSGIYEEPRYTGNLTVCGKVTIVDCVSEHNGLRGGNQPGQTTVVKEGEQANFFIHTGTLTRCISRGGRKAGYYAMNVTQPSGVGLELHQCVDCGSEHGFVLEGNDTANVKMVDCQVTDALERAVVAMGKNVKITNLKVKAKSSSVPPIWLGVHIKLINADSADASNQADVKSKLAMTWGMPGFALSGCVSGLAAGVKPYEIRPGSTVNGTGASGSPSGITLAVPCASPLGGC